MNIDDLARKTIARQHAEIEALTTRANRYEGALLDIAKSDPIPTVKDAYGWCVDVARAALGAKADA